MGKKSKLIAFEFRKLFSNVAIYITTFLVVVITIILGLIYKPKNKVENVLNYDNETVISVYNSFYNNTQKTNKVTLDNNIIELKEYLNSYLVETDFKKQLQDYTNEIKTYYETIYRQNLYTGASSEYLSNNSASLLEKISKLENYFNSLIKNNNLFILITTNEYENFIQNIKALKQTLPSSYVDYPTHQAVINKIESNKYISKVIVSVNSVSNIVINKDTINSLVNDYILKTQEKLKDIETKITSFKDNKTISNNTNDLNTINSLINNYYQVVNQTKIIVKNTVDNKIVNLLNNHEDINKYYGFKDFNTYSSKEELSKNIFLYEKELIETDYNSTFNFSTTGSTKTNLYDFTFFALEIISVIIILYMFYLVASMFAKELNNGTIKFLAIRPYSRNKIYISKVLTILLNIIFMLALSTIIALTVGAVVFPGNVKDILIVINAKSIFIVNPFILICYELISIIIKVLFFMSIALLIGILSKSPLATIISSVSVYVLIIIVNLFLQNSIWYSYFPTANLSLFKFFGNSSYFNDIAQGLFSNNLINGSTLLKSALGMGIVIFLLFFLSYKNFKNKDIA